MYFGHNVYQVSLRPDLIMSRYGQNLHHIIIWVWKKSNGHPIIFFFSLYIMVKSCNQLPPWSYRHHADLFNNCLGHLYSGQNLFAAKCTKLYITFNAWKQNRISFSGSLRTDASGLTEKFQHSWYTSYGAPNGQPLETN